MKRKFIVFSVLSILFTFALLGQPRHKSEQNEIFRVLNQSNSSWIGIRIRNLTTEEFNKLNLKDNIGVYVTGVIENSPAQKAGLQVGDIITKYASIPILGVEHLIQLVRNTTPERKISLDIFRNGKSKILRVTIGEKNDRGINRFFKIMPPAPESPNPPPSPERELKHFLWFHTPQRPRLGIYFEELTEQLGQFLGVPNGKGVLITSVIKGSPAEKAGIKAGDVIIKVNEQQIADSDDLMDALADLGEAENIKISIIRKGKTMTFNVKLKNVSPRSSKHFSL